MKIKCLQKGINSLSHFNLVRKFFQRVKRGTIPGILVWKLTKVINKEVIDEARNKGRKVHIASLMGLCHLKNSE